MSTIDVLCLPDSTCLNLHVQIRTLLNINYPDFVLSMEGTLLLSIVVIIKAPIL